MGKTASQQMATRDFKTTKAVVHDFWESRSGDPRVSG